MYIYKHAYIWVYSIKDVNIASITICVMWMYILKIDGSIDNEVHYAMFHNILINTVLIKVIDNKGDPINGTYFAGHELDCTKNTGEWLS